MAVAKKIQTGVFTTGGKRVNDIASAIAGSINSSQSTQPPIEYPQPGTYDIIGQPSGIYDINDSGQNLGIKDTTNDWLKKYLASGDGSSNQNLIDYLNRQQGRYRSQLNTGGYKQPTNRLSSELERQYGVASGNIDNSNVALMDFLGKQTNPFANVTAAATTVDPQFNALLEQQGVSTAPVNTQYEAQKQAAMDSDAQFNNLIGILKGLYDQGLVDAKTAASLSKDFATQNLETNRALYGMDIANKEYENKKTLQNTLDETLLKLATAGGKVKNRSSRKK
jgi:hypothetical protein